MRFLSSLGVVLLLSLSSLLSAAPVQACNSHCYESFGCHKCDFSLFPGTLCWDAITCFACIEWDCPDSNDPQIFPSSPLQSDEGETISRLTCDGSEEDFTPAPVPLSFRTLPERI